MKITKHVAEPVIVPPTTYTLELSEDEIMAVRVALATHTYGPRAFGYDTDQLSGFFREEIGRVGEQLFLAGIDSAHIRNRMKREGQD